jgi:hypothetical protein
MSENVIDSENTSKPAPEAAKPKGARKRTKKAKPAKKVGRAKTSKPMGDSYQQEGRGDRHDETRQGRLPELGVNIQTTVTPTGDVTLTLNGQRRTFFFTPPANCHRRS